jgi:hypothetical protein
VAALSRIAKIPIERKVLLACDLRLRVLFVDESLERADILRRGEAEASERKLVERVEALLMKSNSRIPWMLLGA